MDGPLPGRRALRSSATGQLLVPRAKIASYQFLLSLVLKLHLTSSFSPSPTPTPPSSSSTCSREHNSVALIPVGLMRLTQSSYTQGAMEKRVAVRQIGP